jgi:hypothetical protein
MKRVTLPTAAMPRLLLACMLSVIACFGITGCSSQGTTSAPAETESEGSSGELFESSYGSDMTAAYAEVLDQARAGELDFNNPELTEYDVIPYDASADADDITQHYALQDMTGDGIPELIVTNFAMLDESVLTEGSSTLTNVLIYRYDEDEGTAVPCDGIVSLTYTGAISHETEELYTDADHQCLYVRHYNYNGDFTGGVYSEEEQQSIADDPRSGESVANTIDYKRITLNDGAIAIETLDASVSDDLGTKIDLISIDDTSALDAYDGMSRSEVTEATE